MRARRAVGAILAMVLGAGIVACLLPDNDYQRWQLLDGTIQARARWIYERVHDDPTPIDVAFIGPSRTSQGIDAPRLAAALAARGLPANVVNFALAEGGRNMNYVIANEMLKTKLPRLLVIGVIEKPQRTGHPAFKYIAPAGMVVDPGFLADTNYVDDLMYLPFRQLRLFGARLWPAGFGLTKTFDPARYRGSIVQTTGNVILPDGSIRNGVQPGALPELMRGVRKLERGMTPPILPERYADLEFGAERHYVREIVRLARAKGVRVAFLMLPYYTGPATVQDEKFYRAFGPVWNAGFLAHHSELYADYAHLTHHGADLVTDMLVDPVSSMIAAPR